MDPLREAAEYGIDIAMLRDNLALTVAERSATPPHRPSHRRDALESDARVSNVQNLLQRLTGAGVESAIVGGYAGIVYGCTYVTQDIEVCCDFSPPNLLALQRALCDVHPVHRMTPGRKALEPMPENAAECKNLYLDTDMGRLDCLSHIDGLGRCKQVKRAREQVEVEGVQFHVLTIDSYGLGKILARM